MYGSSTFDRHLLELVPFKNTLQQPLKKGWYELAIDIGILSVCCHLSVIFSPSISLHSLCQPTPESQESKPKQGHYHILCLICVHSFRAMAKSVFGGVEGWAYSIARPWVLISSPLTHMVYLSPLLGYLADSKSGSARPTRIRWQLLPQKLKLPPAAKTTLLYYQRNGTRLANRQRAQIARHLTPTTQW